MNYFNRSFNLVVFSIAMLSFTMTTACSQSDFAGDSAPQKADAKTKKPNPKPCSGPTCATTTTHVDPPPSEVPGQLSTDNGGISGICDPATMVTDPNATEVITGRANVVNYVNSICGEKLSNNFNGVSCPSRGDTVGLKV